MASDERKEMTKTYSVTIYYSDGPHIYTGDYDYVVKMRERAIILGIACSGIREGF